MRQSIPFFLIIATALSGFTCFATILLVPGFAVAAERETGRAECTCPGTGTGTGENALSHSKFADLKPSLDVSDEIAALESVQLALSEVGDGSSYVWHRYHGRLSGVVTPTSSFKDASGTVCRHVVVVLSSGTRSKRSEGIACRLSSGQWQLQG